MVITTEMKLPDNSEICAYLDRYVRKYQRIWRRVYDDLVNGVFEDRFNGNVNDYTKFIKSHYNVLTRVANSIVRDARGCLKAHLEARKAQLAELDVKVGELEGEIKSLQERVSHLKGLARENALAAKGLRELREDKRALYLKRDALYRKKQKREKWAKQIKEKRVPITFGSKKLFCAQFHLERTKYRDFGEWQKAHDFALNHNVLFIGRIDEARANSMVQLFPREDGTFDLRLRKDYGFRTPNGKACIEETGLKLKYMDGPLRHILTSKTREEGKRPVTCRFHKREGKGWYLQVIFETDKADCPQSESDGVVAVDYNDSLLAVTELDPDGNLVNSFNLKLRHHGSGGRALAEIRDVAKEVVLYASGRGKPVVIEDLDFRKTKARTKKGRRGKYNKMVHSLDYSRFRECVERAGERHLVKVVAVNPAYTTKIGVQKFRKRMCLTRHAAASMVIGRRAMGFADVCTEEKRKGK